MGASRLVGTRDALCSRKTIKGRTHALSSAVAGRRVVVRNPLEPESMTPAQRLEEVAALLATGFLRLRLRRADSSAVALSNADGRKKPLDVPRASSHSCIEPSSEAEKDE